MPVERAEVESVFAIEGFGGLTAGRLKWPLSTLRLVGADKQALLALSVKILEIWRGYSDPELGIEAESAGVPHNTITPVARKRGPLYELDLILRNNRTNPERPYGIFHPRQAVHHVKKENIGLIEAMGLAILPPRLLGELSAIERTLSEGRRSLSGLELEGLEKHEEWYRELYPKASGATDLKSLIEREVGERFLICLLDAGVFKRDPVGLAGFDRLIAKVAKV
jgi:UDPglucose--hexose-1-phosphate uridylyltransferase